MTIKLLWYWLQRTIHGILMKRSEGDSRSEFMLVCRMVGMAGRVTDEGINVCNIILFFRGDPVSLTRFMLKGYFAVIRTEC